jgi:hypothetical protein
VSEVNKQLNKKLKFHRMAYKKQVLVLLLAVVPEAMLDAALGPLFPYMVRYLLPNETEETVAFHVSPVLI